MKTATIHRESNQLIPRNSFLGRKGSPLPPWKPHRLCLFSLSAPTDTYMHMAGDTHMAGEQLSCHSNAPSSTHRHASGPWREVGPHPPPTATRQAHGGKRAPSSTHVRPMEGSGLWAQRWSSGNCRTPALMCALKMPGAGPRFSFPCLPASHLLLLIFKMERMGGSNPHIRMVHFATYI